MNIDVNVPDGKSGGWSVETFEVSKEDADLANMRAMFSFSTRSIAPGTYKRLKRGGATIMSNTPMEISDCRFFIYKAKGNILINGLGLGVVLVALLKKPEVKNITVIEKSQDVISLVAPTFTNDKRLSIIHADALEWKPPKGVRYDCIWHDIWDDICADNLSEMTTLHRKYGRRTDWQDSWCKELCKRHR